MTKSNSLKEAIKTGELCKNCGHDRFWNTTKKCTKCGHREND